MRRAAHVAAVLLGAASVAAYGDLNLFLLPLVAHAGLVWLWHRAPTPRAAAQTGFAFGAGFFLTGVSWVYVSLHDFGMMPAPLAAIATLVFCLYLALYPAAVGWAQARLGGAPLARFGVVVPALWTLSEWLRSWVFTGFPWNALGYSQLDAPPAGFAPVIGVFGVSFAAQAVAGLAVAALVSRGRARTVALAALVLIVAGGAALRGVVWTVPTGAPVTVALLQGNIPQDLKFVPGRFESTIETYARLAEGSQAKLIVMPETAIPRFLEQVDPAYLERLKRHAVASGGDMLVGAPVHDAERRYFNAVVSLGSSPRQGYAKSHLVPFGEFIPPGFGWIIAVLKIPLSDFSRGPVTQAPLAVAGERVAVNICYEDAFGEEIVRQLPAASLLVNVSNVAWFGDSLAPEQHLRISRMRSVETGRYMLRATNTGVTAIVDQTGRVIARLPAFTEGRLEGTAQGHIGATPYVQVGNWPVVLGSLAIVIAWLAWRRRG